MTTKNVEGRETSRIILFVCNIILRKEVKSEKGNNSIMAVVQHFLSAG